MKTVERRAEARSRLAQEDCPPVATLGLVPRAALVCDISGAGLGLLTTVAPPEGAVVPVWLPGPPGTASELLLATVVYARPAGHGLYRVGLACREESRPQLRHFVERLPGLGWAVLPERAATPPGGPAAPAGRVRPAAG
jgi:hypothetical protein